MELPSWIQKTFLWFKWNLFADHSCYCSAKTRPLNYIVQTFGTGCLARPFYSNWTKARLLFEKLKAGIPPWIGQIYDVLSRRSPSDYVTVFLWNSLVTSPYKFGTFNILIFLIQCHFNACFVWGYSRDYQYQNFDSNTNTIVLEIIFTIAVPTIGNEFSNSSSNTNFQPELFFQYQYLIQ